MCSNSKTLACIFDNKNQSILSDTYKRSSRPLVTTTNIFSNNLNQIQIKFKNKYRTLTAIDECTNFDDLKLALIISSYKKRLAKSGQPEHVQLKKFQKNFEELKRMASYDYVICECVNNVEKMIDSTQNVRDVLKRIHREAIFLKDFKVTHSMRLKRSLERLSPEPCVLKKTARSSKPVAILEEFYIKDNQEIGDVEVNATYENVEPNDIDNQLIRFEKYIEQRKKYIELLEQYIGLTDDLEADLLVTDCKNDFCQAGGYDIESSDTGFSSVESEVSVGDSVSEKFNDWCVDRSVPHENRLYYLKISNFETYV